jgi:hypothetical protein
MGTVTSRAGRARRRTVTRHSSSRPCSTHTRQSTQCAHPSAEPVPTRPQAARTGWRAAACPARAPG